MEQTPTVFVVDDDAGVRESISLFLLMEGFTVESFQSARDFLAAYSADRVGCLVLDIGLPDMSGLALQETLAEKHLPIPIIFITGHGDVPMSVQAMKAGAFDLIEKPIDPEILSLRIREAIERDLDRRQLDMLSDTEALETLHSIGDAVITTDASGIIRYLNPIAEEMTGWQVMEAQGLPIDEVFNIVDEFSRSPMENPVSQCLEHGEPCRLMNHAALVRPDGTAFPIEDSASPIRGQRGELLGVVLVFKDVTEQRRVMRELTHHAMHDPLTGLVNRREFERRLEHALASSKTHGAQHTLCYIDLDEFKAVNDTAGHAAGDELLRQVTALLTEKVRERDTLARLGGDEFGLMLSNCPIEKAEAIAKELIAVIHDFRFVVNEQLFKIGASIGLVPITFDSTSVIDTISQADVACYAAKQMGRNQAHVWQGANVSSTYANLEIPSAHDLSQAISENHFLLYSQPIVPLHADHTRPVKGELLLRLLGNEGEAVLPNAFIPVAERHGLMSAIDQWVIHTALHRYADICGETATPELSINLSSNSFSDGSLLEYVRRQLMESGTSPDRVCFEISETTTIHNLTQVQQFIKATKSLGCRIALDNFGSGVSSFSYLKKLDVDYVKIDGSYVRDMLDNPFSNSMVEAISNIGHSLGIQVIAGWAESQDVVTSLKGMGVDYAQGLALYPPERLKMNLAPTMRNMH